MAGNDWKLLLKLEQDLCRKLKNINFYEPPSKIAYVYDPIDYGIQLHLNFLSRFFTCPKMILFVGMNPGPFGMAQTGVPFGDVVTVREWMKVNGSLEKLPPTHPSKPIKGLDCGRTEVSGARFWGLFWNTLKLSPDKFFENCFVLNVCPLLFLDANGRNISMPEIRASMRNQIEHLCDSFLVEALKLMKPEIIIGIGKYATARIQKVIPLLNMGQPKMPETPKVVELIGQEICSTTPFHHAINHSSLNEITSKGFPCNLQVAQSSNQAEASAWESGNGAQKDSDSTLHQGDPHGSPAINSPKVFTLMHPSPANPTANKGWDAIALKQLKEFGILDLIDS